MLPENSPFNCGKNSKKDIAATLCKNSSATMNCSKDVQHGCNQHLFALPNRGRASPSYSCKTLFVSIISLASLLDGFAPVFHWFMMTSQIIFQFPLQNFTATRATMVDFGSQAQVGNEHRASHWPRHAAAAAWRSWCCMDATAGHSPRDFGRVRWAQEFIIHLRAFSVVALGWHWDPWHDLIRYSALDAATGIAVPAGGDMPTSWRQVSEYC